MIFYFRKGMTLMKKKTTDKRETSIQIPPEPELVLTEKEKLINDYTGHLMEKSEHDYITWSDLNGIIDILKDKWYPSDCERATDNENKCLSQIGHLCNKNVCGICTET